jgi:hypothetical protein
VPEASEWHNSIFLPLRQSLNQMVSDLQMEFESQITFYNSVVKRENKGFVNGKGWRNSR